MFSSLHSKPRHMRKLTSGTYTPYLRKTRPGASICSWSCSTRQVCSHEPRGMCVQYCLIWSLQVLYRGPQAQVQKSFFPWGISS
jgi:hypothetical protein